MFWRKSDKASYVSGLCTGYCALSYYTPSSLLPNRLFCGYLTWKFLGKATDEAIKPKDMKSFRDGVWTMAEAIGQVWKEDGIKSKAYRKVAELFGRGNVRGNDVPELVEYLHRSMDIVKGEILDVDLERDAIWLVAGICMPAYIEARSDDVESQLTVYQMARDVSVGLTGSESILDRCFENMVRGAMLDASKEELDAFCIGVGMSLIVMKNKGTLGSMAAFQGLRFVTNRKGLEWHIENVVRRVAR